MKEEGSTIVFAPKNNSRQALASWGLSRALLANMVQGVSQGWTKELEIRGVGFRAAIEGKTLKLNLGFSHDVNYPIPEGVEMKCERPTSILISGIDKQKIGQIAAEIRRFRPPEPYKGKGVRYLGEYVMQKEGKKK
jgi:large subunit ribosomal protein L6